MVLEISKKMWAQMLLKNIVYIKNMFFLKCISTSIGIYKKNCYNINLFNILSLKLRLIRISTTFISEVKIFWHVIYLKHAYATLTKTLHSIFLSSRREHCHLVALVDITC